MLRVFLSLSLLAALAGAPLAARDGGQRPGPVATLALALRLYGQAGESSDALGMAVAVRLAGTIRQREAGHWQKDSGKAPGPAIPAAAGAGVTPDLLTSGAAWSGALLMAEEDEALSDLLYELPPPVIRGGVSRARAALAPGHRDSWTLPFAGQSPAEIAVFRAEDGMQENGAAEGGAAQPVLLWSVLDGAGAVLCPERRVAAQICSFTPAENGFYQVIVSNRSDISGHYLLVAN